MLPRDGIREIAQRKDALERTALAEAVRYAHIRFIKAMTIQFNECVINVQRMCNKCVNGVF